MLRHIYETSGGNPLYALAIAREFASERHGDPGVQQLPIPRSLTDAVAQRLDDLDPRAMDPLLVTASVSQPTIALLRSVLPRFTLADLDGPAEAGVIEAGRRAPGVHAPAAGVHRVFEGASGRGGASFTACSLR